MGQIARIRALHEQMLEALDQAAEQAWHALMTSPPGSDAEARAERRMAQLVALCELQMGEEAN